MDGVRRIAKFRAMALSLVLFLTALSGIASGYSEVIEPSRGKIIVPKDPVWASSRRSFISQPLFNLGGPLPLRYSLYYPAPYGSNTVQDYTPIISYGEGIYAFVELFGSDKATFSVDKTGGRWGDPTNTSRGYSLKETDRYFYLRDPVDDLVYLFYKPSGGTANQMCDLAYVMDRKGNVLTYTDIATGHYKILDGIGRSLDIVTSYTAPRGIAVTDQGGRSWFRGEGQDATGIYFSTVDPLKNTTKYYWGQEWWSSEDVRKIVRPLGNSPATNTFERGKCGDADCGLVTSQTDAYGNVTTLTAGTGVDVTGPDTSVTNFQFKSDAPASITDPAGHKVTFATNARGQITSITDRTGAVTLIGYHGSGKIASITGANNKTIAATYTAQTQTLVNPANAEEVSIVFYNLTRIDYPDGTNEQLTYDGRGNRLTGIDRAGKTWTYTYNNHGRVLTARNPAGGTTTYTYNSDATVASKKDPDGIVTTYSYDTYKRLRRITNGDKAFAEIGYDLNDRITSLEDENGNAYSFTYDANGNLVAVTDPEGHQETYAYDLMDRMTRVTNRLAKTTTATYDNMGRLASVTNPVGLATTAGYDIRGWRNAVTIGGKTWGTGYDDEGVVTSKTTPLGTTTTYKNDKTGYITAVTNPMNETTTVARDSLTRITGVTDPLGRTTAYTYDGRGPLSSVTVPGAGTATYGLNDLGLLSRVTDLKGSIWNIAYTLAGRFQSLTDPLGNSVQDTYDTVGRPVATTYATGETRTRTYDDAGNITRSLYSKGPDLTFAYDKVNRLLTTNGLTLTRDAEGKVTSTGDGEALFGATYDAAGRLAAVSYNNNAFTVTYTYDGKTGLLTGVDDNLANASMDFTYDADRLITGITRSNGVPTTYTRDNAGRITRIQDGSITDLQYVLDKAGQVTSVSMTVPLNPLTALTSGTSTFVYDKASQISSSGYAYDKRGRLTAAPGRSFAWSGDSKPVSVDGTALAYNGEGDLRTRASTRYLYNKALRLTPVVAERDEVSGNMVRYYVWTPEGQLLYMIDGAGSNKVYFYHFDRTGSTLALTDGTGTVTDAYAYTPYGRVLQHTGTNPQPFTFVGKGGVRQEGSSGTLFHMRARYYDAKAARFISRDPLWPRTGDARQLNPYQYAGSNPITRTDIMGKEFDATEARKEELEIKLERLEARYKPLREKEFDLTGAELTPQEKEQIEYLESEMIGIQIELMGGIEVFLSKKNVFIKMGELLQRGGLTSQERRWLKDQQEELWFGGLSDISILEGEAQGRNAGRHAIVRPPAYRPYAHTHEW